MLYRLYSENTLDRKALEYYTAPFVKALENSQKLHFSTKLFSLRVPALLDGKTVHWRITFNFRGHYLVHEPNDVNRNYDVKYVQQVLQQFWENLSFHAFGQSEDTARYFVYTYVKYYNTFVKYLQYETQNAHLDWLFNEYARVYHPESAGDSVFHNRKYNRTPPSCVSLDWKTQEILENHEMARSNFERVLPKGFYWVGDLEQHLRALDAFPFRYTVDNLPTDLGIFRVIQHNGHTDYLLTPEFDKTGYAIYRIVPEILAQEVLPEFKTYEETDLP